MKAKKTDKENLILKNHAHKNLNNNNISKNQPFQNHKKQDGIISGFDYF